MITFFGIVVAVVGFIGIAATVVSWLLLSYFASKD